MAAPDSILAVRSKTRLIKLYFRCTVQFYVRLCPSSGNKKAENRSNPVLILYSGSSGLLDVLLLDVLLNSLLAISFKRVLYVRTFIKQLVLAMETLHNRKQSFSTLAAILSLSDGARVCECCMQTVYS